MSPPIGADELVDRARDMVGWLRLRTAANEADRRVSDEIVAAFTDADFFRVLQPSRYGGLELDYGTQTRIASELARGCASSAWVYGVLASHSWLLGMFPDDAQADVWGDGSDSLVSTGFFAETQSVERSVSGGAVISGRWKFSSGIDACDWVIVMVQAPAAAGASPEPHMMLVPIEHVTVDDTWFATGLAGTGSKDILADRVVVPSHRIVPVAALRGGPTPGSAVNESHLYRLGLFTVFPYCTIGTALGAARAAFDEILTRSITASSTAVRPPVPRNAAERLARSTAIADTVEGSLSHMAARINRDARNGVVPTDADKVRCRLNLGYAAEQLVQAVDVLVPLLGARGLDIGDPVQRAWRDVHAVTQHVALTWDVQSTLFGEVLFGGGCPDPKI